MNTWSSSPLRSKKWNCYACMQQALSIITQHLDIDLWSFRKFMWTRNLGYREPIFTCIKPLQCTLVFKSSKIWRQSWCAHLRRRGRPHGQTGYSTKWIQQVQWRRIWCCTTPSEPWRPPTTSQWKQSLLSRTSSEVVAVHFDRHKQRPQSFCSQIKHFMRELVSLKDSDHVDTENLTTSMSSL